MNYTKDLKELYEIFNVDKKYQKEFDLDVSIVYDYTCSEDIVSKKAKFISLGKLHCVGYFEEKAIISKGISKTFENLPLTNTE